ncbi:MAG: helix-turn-helix domain-containing protein [Candidatus Hodarchaeales archaeon]
MPLTIPALVEIIRNCVKEEFEKRPAESICKEDHEKLLSTEEVCKIFNVSTVTLYKWKKKGLIPYYKVGRRVYFKNSEIIESLKTKKRKLEVAA